MTSPFTRLNTAAIRAERRGAALRAARTALALGLILVATVLFADALLSNALAYSELPALAQDRARW